MSKRLKNLGVALSGQLRHESKTELLREAQNPPGWEFFLDTSDGTTDGSRAIGDTVSTDRWVHFAGSFDGSTVNIFIDGEEEASVSHSGSLDDPVDGAFIGAWQKGNGEIIHQWDVELDEVRFYARALSAEEIQALACDPDVAE